MFPRIFALSINKCGKVKEFGSWRNKVWYWKIVLKKGLFGWKLQQWHDLLVLLKEFVVCDKLNDSFIWKSSPSGKYSANSFVKSIIHSN
ncbi:hypothetical protein CRYUN_Cryun04dG0071000 [Craigia yunnanensis]